jgi:hypothetical protein
LIQLILVQGSAVGEENAKTDIVVVVVAVVPDANGRAAIPSNVVPGAATQHSEITVTSY